MITYKQYIYIPDYNWHLTIIYRAGLDIAVVANELWLISCPNYIAKEALRIIQNKNTGFCYTHFDYSATVIGIAVTSNIGEFINTVVHELCHFMMHLCDYYNIDEHSEEAAYLIGDTAQKLYKNFKYGLE